MEQTKQSEIIRVAFENVKSIVDSNTVTGEPISVPGGTVIIPVSKVSVGLATGGVDYSSKKINTAKNFGGGGGTGVSVSPVGFLTISQSGSVNLLNFNQENKDSFTKIVDLVNNSPDIIEKLKKAIYG